MDLTSDTKYLVAEKLTGKELFKLCSSDPDMRKLFLRDKYNYLWQNKLKDDYNVNYTGANPYMEYLKYIHLNETTYWTVSKILYSDDPEELGCSSHIFKGREDEINWVYSDVLFEYYEDIPSFPIFYSEINTNKDYTFQDFKYFLSNSKIKIDTPTNYIERYKDKLRKIASFISKDGQDIKDIEMFVNDFMNDFETDYEGFWEYNCENTYNDNIERLEYEKYKISKEAKKLIKDLIINRDSILD